MLLVSTLIIIVYNWVVPKTVVEKFSFSELKIEKIKLFTRSLTKFIPLVFLMLEVAQQVASLLEHF